MPSRSARLRHDLRANRVLGAPAHLGMTPARSISRLRASLAWHRTRGLAPPSIGVAPGRLVGVSPCRPRTRASLRHQPLSASHRGVSSAPALVALAPDRLRTTGDSLAPASIGLAPTSVGTRTTCVSLAPTSVGARTTGLPRTNKYRPRTSKCRDSHPGCLPRTNECLACTTPSRPTPAAPASPSCFPR